MGANRAHAGHWYIGSSDHVMLTAGQARTNGRPKTCTPAALKQLPGLAWLDLRRAYRGLEVRLAIPDNPPIPTWRPTTERTAMEELDPGQSA